MKDEQNEFMQHELRLPGRAFHDSAAPRHGGAQ